MKQAKRRIAALLLVILTSAQLSLAQTMSALDSNSSINSDEALKALQQYVPEVMKRLPYAPGVSVAVVRGDQVIYAGGFGYRDLKRKLPVTSATGFYIASTTKSFTGTAAKMLADEGLLDLDAPIKKYLPGLTLKAPLSAEQITTRDLLTHRHGITSDPVEFRTAYTGQHSPDLILKLLGQGEPTGPSFRYSNIGYITASLIMEKVAGQPWQQIIQKRIFDPLGMTNSTCYASKARASKDVALPYLAEGGEFRELPYKEDNTMHAAGGIVSSAEDLAAWLILNMNGGKYKGKQIISPISMEEIHSVQVGQKRAFYEYERYGYGFGWNIGSYKGHKLIHAFGTYDGFRPHVSFMPEKKIGVIVLVNESRDGFMLPDIIATDIYDLLLSGKPLDARSNPRIEAMAREVQKSRESRAKKALEREKARETVTKASLPTAAYVGVFENLEMGRIVITEEGEALLAKFGNLSSRLTHFTRDTFEAALIQSNPNRIDFKVNQQGEVSELSMAGKAFARVQGSP